MCKAQWNGIKVFEAAGQSVVTGCTSQPIPKSTLCSLHQGESTPVTDTVTRETRSSIKKKKNVTNNGDAQFEDHLFIVESILEVTVADGKKLYKVKWYGYDENDSTIEPEENIPKFIQKYYSDPSKLGQKLPNPKVKHSKQLTNGSSYHYLTWEGEEGGSWLSDDFFSLVGNDEASITKDFPDLSCGTRKSRDKRVCRYNVGIFLGAFPCGIVPLWDELFGCESISQVYGVFIEFLDQLPKEEREKLTDLIYDDNCHLSRFSSNKARASRNDVTSFFAQVRKSIDRFHFGNHVDKWCMENCNPYKIEDLKNVNTMICEQLFKKVNSHTNCTTMNESRYFLFWVYNLDLHNLDIEGKASSIPDPRCEDRWKLIEIVPANLQDLNKMNLEEVDAVSEKFENINLDREVPLFKCKLCDAGYDKEGYLDLHLKEKHNQEASIQCLECDKTLTSKRNLDNHISNVHRKYASQASFSRLQKNWTNTRCPTPLVRSATQASKPNISFNVTWSHTNLTSLVFTLIIIMLY